MARKAEERSHRGSAAMAGNAGRGVLGVCAKTSGAGAGALAATSAARAGISEKQMRMRMCLGTLMQRRAWTGALKHYITLSLLSAI